MLKASCIRNSWRVECLSITHLNIVVCNITTFVKHVKCTAMHQPRICICICELASFLMTSDCKSDSLMCVNGQVVYLSDLGEGEDSSSSVTTTLTPSSAVSCISVTMVTVTSSCLLSDAGSDSPRQRGRTGLLLIYNTHTHTYYYSLNTYYTYYSLKWDQCVKTKMRSDISHERTEFL